MFPLADLRELLALPTSPPSDLLLVHLEEAAVAYVERYTGQYFRGPEAYAEAIKGIGTRDLWLTYPTASITSISETPYVGIDDPETVDSDLYVLRGDRRVTRVDTVWTRGQEFVVQYTRGYQPTFEPPEIRDAVLSLVRYRVSQASNPQAGAIKSETIGSYSYTLFDANNAQSLTGFGSVKEVLDLWRSPVFE